MILVNLLNKQENEGIKEGSQKEIENLHILQLKGINEYIDKIDPNVLRARLCMGFLEKRRKKLAMYQKRWFIHISANPIVV